METEKPLGEKITRDALPDDVTIRWICIGAQGMIWMEGCEWLRSVKCSPCDQQQDEQQELPPPPHQT